MNLKKMLYILFVIIVSIYSSNIIIFKEPIVLYLLYVLFLKYKNIIFIVSSIILFISNINLFLKNCILFILFEIILIIFSNNKKLNKKAKYRMFMLTFFCYLVLINVFEPMVYNYIRILESIYLYIVTFMFYKLSVFLNK